MVPSSKGDGVKRDMDLIREILLAIEADPGANWKRGEVSISDRTQEEISFHIRLMKDAGLLLATDLSSQDDILFYPTRITWDGYEFLDAARDNTVWQTAKKRIGDKLASVSFQILQQTLIAIATNQLGLN